jgi:PKD domain
MAAGIGKSSWSLAPRGRLGLSRHAFVIVGILGILLLASLSGGALSAGGPSNATPALAASPAPAPAGASATAPAASECSPLESGWAAASWLQSAPAISGSLQSPCLLSHDEPGLYLVSNASGSAAHLQLSIQLPANGTSPASAYQSFWVGMWVAGVPCSFGGESYLRVELLPPYTSLGGVEGSPFWTVRAPVWDLVPAGSCDSQCSNDTAFFTILGRSYCEDDAMLAGIGALNATAAGAFAPGDALTLTFVGAANKSTPLAVFLNDSSNPTRDLAWSYSGNRTMIDGVERNATVSGEAITPFFENASASDRGWTDALGIGFGWEDCPLPSFGPASGSSCNSYNGPITGVAGSPLVEHATSWNTTAHAYSNLYPFLETASSSGACSGNLSAAPCQDFESYGGSGSYPTFAITAGGGASWFSLGPKSASDVTTFGPLASEFPANGTPSGLIDPTTISGVHASVTSTTVTVAARVTDPNGVANVAVTAWWCNLANSRNLSTTRATIVPAPPNTFLDGNYTAVLPTNSWTGNFYYWVQATSATGVATAPIYGNTSITVGSTSCGITAPPPPTVSSAFIYPTGGGYELNWSEPAAVGATHYVIQATPSAGGLPSVFEVGNQTSARIGGLVGNKTYGIEVVAYNAANLNAPSAVVTAVATLYPLVALPPQAAVLGTWVNNTQAGITENVTGGLPPFQMTFSFGDGTSTVIFTTSGDGSVIHSFTNNYSGYARVVVSTIDSAGDSTVSSLLFVPVQATPLATPQSISVGNGFAAINWSAPRTPAPVVATTIFWTTNASWAPYLTLAWPSNSTVPAIQVVTVSSLLDLTRWVLPLPLGTRVFAQVVSVNKYGDGLLPAEATFGAEPYLEAVVAGFAGGPLTGGLLGAAPYNDSFSATFTTGTGDALTGASYHFSDGAILPGTITGTNGTYFANVSYTFVSPGPETVLLYATDSLSQLVLLSLDVDVTPGPDPVVGVTVAPTPVFVNSSVAFTANVTGGSGRYTESWSFGDGGTATGASVTYAYTSPATYLARVVVNDTLWGGVTTVTVPVLVVPIPSAAIEATASGSIGTYRLTAVVVGGYGNFSYTWLFADGTQGTGTTVTHTWSPGTYTVTLDASDAYGHTAVATVVIVVGASSPSGSGGSTGDPAIYVYALLGALLLVALVAVVFALRGRRPPAPPPEESTGLAPLAPTPYVEEGPRGPG